jgi:DNA polymerase III gamma/tau subunit
MIPLIVISKKPDVQEKYIEDFISTGEYFSYYIFKIHPVKTEISIDQIRAVTKEIIMDIPKSRLFIIYNFDTASLEAQNAFLKTLEEKNEKNQFILLVNDITRVLPTIQSRSKNILLDKDNQEEVVINESVKNLIERIERDKDYTFFSPVSGITRDDAIKLFDHVIVVLREKLKEGNQTTPAILKKALQQKSLLLNNNLNAQLAVDSFFIYYTKQLQKA